MSTTTRNKKTQITTYERIGNNIYFDGASYRVRVIKNGQRYSKNLTSKRAAVQYRNSLLGK
jgi:hypothetical protein